MKEECSICSHEEPAVGRKKRKKKETKSSNIGWICCDNCNKWSHTVCTRINEAVLSRIDNYIYFCVNCCIIGSLTPKATVPGQDDKIKETQCRIDELTTKIAKVQEELTALQSCIKKQFDRVQNKLQNDCRQEEMRTTSYKFVQNIEQKLEEIESGAKLANSCSQSVNCCRIAMNKVP